MPKRAGHSAPLSGSTKQPTPTPAPQTGTNEHDAREDEGKLEKNRNDLGVADDHKTEDMEQGKRGTFP